ncbi:MAG: hypothetical protein ACLUFM_05110 [Lachnospiraceae bacterium]
MSFHKNGETVYLLRRVRHDFGISSADHGCEKRTVCARDVPAGNRLETAFKLNANAPVGADEVDLVTFGENTSAPSVYSQT